MGACNLVVLAIILLRLLSCCRDVGLVLLLSSGVFCWLGGFELVFVWFGLLYGLRVVWVLLLMAFLGLVV